MANNTPANNNQNPPSQNNTNPSNNKNNKNNKSNKNNKNNNLPPDLKGANNYSKNTPMLIIIGIFLFFVLFALLKNQKYRDQRLKQKIDAEIRKKLYFTDEY